MPPGPASMFFAIFCRDEQVGVGAGRRVGPLGVTKGRGRGRLGLANPFDLIPGESYKLVAYTYIRQEGSTRLVSWDDRPRPGSEHWWRRVAAVQLAAPAPTRAPVVRIMPPRRPPRPLRRSDRPGATGAHPQPGAEQSPHRPPLGTNDFALVKSATKAAATPFSRRRAT